MKWIVLILVVNLIGCVNKPDKKYEYDPDGKCNNIFCLALAISMSVSNNQFQKCSDMSGDKRKDCEAEVELIKKYIKDAGKK